MQEDEKEVEEEEEEGTREGGCYRGGFARSTAARGLRDARRETRDEGERAHLRRREQGRKRKPAGSRERVEEKEGRECA